VYKFIYKITIGLVVVLASRLMYCAIWAAMKISEPFGFIGRIVARFVPESLPERLLSLVGRFSRDPLAKGERRRVAEMYWPPEQYPTLYMSVPADMRRPLYEDGRWIGGVPMAWGVDRVFSAGVLAGCWRSSVAAGASAAVGLLVLTAIIWYWQGSAAADLGTLGLSRLPAAGDVWPGEAQQVVSGWWVFWVQAAAVASKTIVGLPSALIAAALSALLIAIAGTLIFSRRVIADLGRDYITPTKDSMVRWRTRAEYRTNAYRAYSKSVMLATTFLATSRMDNLIEVGTATGTLRVRGDLTAPMPGQPVCLDGEAATQGTVCLGATGEGKTMAIIKGYARARLAVQPGYPTCGALIMDGKGVLYKDLTRLVQQIGRGDDIVTIGPGKNDYGVDLLAGLSPSIVAGTLKSVLAQMGGGGSKDSFWPDMAAELIRNVATVAQAFEATPEGREEAKKTGIRPFSIWSIYRGCIEPGVTERWIEACQKIYAPGGREANEFWPLIDTPEYRASAMYLTTAWKEMAEATRTGIIANVTQLLGPLQGQDAVRKKFCIGGGEKRITIDAVLDGKIVMSTLSTVEHGVPARIVMIFLRTLLHRAARIREGKFGKDHCQSKPAVEILDEAQEILVADKGGNNGLDDASFWAVSRSTGLSILACTQTVVGLENSLGKDQAANFLLQMRNKIFLRTEDKSTIDYAVYLAGSFQGSQVYEPGQHASLESRYLLTGFDAEQAPPTYVEPSIHALADLAWDAMGDGSDPLDVSRPATASPHEPDMRFAYRPISAPGQDNNASYYGALQAAYWRAEDKTSEMLKTGNEMTPALSTVDLLSMGRFHAFVHVQRAGLPRQDIVVVRHDFT
jgi:hypothetical protein